MAGTDQSPIIDWREFRHETRVRNLLFHTLVTSDFYEPITAYAPSAEYRELVAAALDDRWLITRSGLWFEARLLSSPEVPLQGWKVHLSATPRSAAQVLRAASAVARCHRVSFKFLCDSRLLELMNDKPADRGTSGKFVTMYPTSAEQARALLRELSEVLVGVEGPFILSDRRYQGSRVVHYRYGGLRRIDRVDPMGQRIPVLIGRDGRATPDLRVPYFFLPPGIIDEMQAPETQLSESGEPPTLKEGRYRIELVRSFSNAGGVYEATDLNDGRAVIVKEARPHTSATMHGMDSVALRQQEFRFLKELAGRGIAPAPLDLFWDWEHLFLVEEKIDGVTAGRYATSHSPVYVPHPGPEAFAAYFAFVARMTCALASVLDDLHENDIVYGDLSPSNIVITPDERFVLVDFETAARLHSQDARRLFTAGFTDMSRLRAPLSPADDYYSLGCVTLWMLAPVNAMFELRRDVADVFLEDWTHEFGLPPALRTAVLDLLDADVARRPQADEIRHRLRREPEPALAEPQPIAKAESTEKETEGDRMVTAIADFILACSRPSEPELLFRVSPSSPNPLNVGHGALGIARALHLLGRDLDSPRNAWLMSQHPDDAVYPPGLYPGLAGLAWAYADLGDLDRGIALGQQAFRHPMLFEEAGVFAGAAGVGLSLLELWTRSRHQVLLDCAVRVGQELLAIAQESDRGISWVDHDGATPLGYARGASGAALFLLYLSLATSDSRWMAQGRRALDFDLSYATSFKGGLTLPEDTDAGNTIVFPYWYRGSAGLGTSVLRYALCSPDSDLDATVNALVAACSCRYTVMPGLFSGLAGLGNFILDCYQLRGDVQFLDVAKSTGVGLRLFALRRPEGVAFPGEDLYRITLDFGTGSAGIALFLQRLAVGGANFNFLPDQLLPSVPRIAPERRRAMGSEVA